ncbi:hypothetical protein Tco_0850216 [Tanacetum coccineum]
MEDPDLTMEEYIQLEAEKARMRDQTFNWETVTYGKVYEGQEYTHEIIYDFEERLGGIFGRQVQRLQVLDFVAFSEEMDQDITDRLRMDHTGGDGQVIFTSHAWRRVFEIQGPLVHELMLEFFSACRFSDTELGLDISDNFCFQLGRLRCKMSWRRFILALGLHIAEEMAGDGLVPYYTSIKDLLRKLCHRLITFSIFRIGQAPKKVTATDIFYLRTMVEETVANVSYLLAQYLFRYAKGSKQGARMCGGHFVARLAEHFRLITEESLWGLTVVVHDLTMIDIDQEVPEEGVQADPTQAPQNPPAVAPVARTIP